MEFLKATNLPFNPRTQISTLVVDAYADLLQHFKKDVHKITRALAESVLLEYFYVAVVNGEVAAIVACKKDKPPPVKLEKRVLVKHLGLIMGNLVYPVINKHMLEHRYPFKLSEQTASIEIVATTAKYRGQGIAQGLMEHVMSELPYKNYVLEVIDINHAAIRLYEKMGFNEIARIASPKNSGFNHFVYLKKETACISG